MQTDNHSVRRFPHTFFCTFIASFYLFNYLFHSLFTQLSHPHLSILKPLRTLHRSHSLSVRKPTLTLLHFLLYTSTYPTLFPTLVHLLLIYCSHPFYDRKIV